MLWRDLKFADERAHPFGLDRPVDPNAPDADLLEFHRRLTGLRARHEVLRTGGFEFTLLDDDRRLIAFRRQSPAGGATVLAIFNASDRRIVLSPADLKLDSHPGWTNLWTGAAATSDALELPPRGFMALGK